MCSKRKSTKNSCHKRQIKNNPKTLDHSNVAGFLAFQATVEYSMRNSFHCRIEPIILCHVLLFFFFFKLYYQKGQFTFYETSCLQTVTYALGLKCFDNRRREGDF